MVVDGLGIEPSYRALQARAEITRLAHRPKLSRWVNDYRVEPRHVLKTLDDGRFLFEKRTNFTPLSLCWFGYPLSVVWNSL